MAELLLDVETERHRTLGLLAQLRMVAAQRDQLLTDLAAAVLLALAVLGMADDALHLVARGQAAVGVAALARVHQRLDAPGDGLFARLDRVGRVGAVGRVGTAAVVQVEAEAFHLVQMALVVVAGHAQVKVVADGAVVPGLHRLFAVVARVHKLVLALEKTKVGLQLELKNLSRP